MFSRVKTDAQWFSAFSQDTFHLILLQFDHVLFCSERDTIAELYHNRDTSKFSKGHVTKNQSMVVVHV